MKIFADTKSHSFEFDLIDNNGDSYLAQNGKKLDIESVALGDGRYSLIKNNRPFIVNISKQSGTFQVRVAGEYFNVQVEDERTRRLKELVESTATDKGEQIIMAPIPGMVFKVLVKTNDKVAAGEGLIILEAMKMENIIKAPFECEVLEVNIKEKDTVNQNQALLKIKSLD